MKIWIDDVRPAPQGYYWAQSVNDAKAAIILSERYNTTIELLDLDHDAGDFVEYGGDFIKILDWMEETDRNYPVRFHTANPVGRMNMIAIAQKNGWRIIP